MADDHAARDLLRKRVREHAPALHDAAVASLTPEQRKEGEDVAAARTQLAAELGDQWPGDRRQRNLEQRAAQVGLSFLYDTLYRYESNASPHPSMLAVDLLLEKHPRGSFSVVSRRRCSQPRPSTCTARSCCARR